MQSAKAVVPQARVDGPLASNRRDTQEMPTLWHYGTPLGKNRDVRAEGPANFRPCCQPPTIKIASRAVGPLKATTNQPGATPQRAGLICLSPLGSAAFVIGRHAAATWRRCKSSRCCDGKCPGHRPLILDHTLQFSCLLNPTLNTFFAGHSTYQVLASVNRSHRFNEVFRVSLSQLGDRVDS